MVTLGTTTDHSKLLVGIIIWNLIGTFDTLSQSMCQEIWETVFLTSLKFPILETFDKKKP